jgi:signal transduction histidine kinase
MQPMVVALVCFFTEHSVFKKLYFLIILLFTGVFTYAANAVLFETRIIDESRQYNVLAISILIFSLVFITFALLKREYIKEVLFGRLSEVKQAQLLIQAFNKMAVIIEKRDNNLSEERNKAVLANKAKSDFILNVSHELRTPMHAILNFAEIGRKKVAESSPEKLVMYFTRIEESGERLLHMINAMLDLTSLEAGKIDFNFTSNDIGKCVEESLSELQSIAHKKNITCKIEKHTNETKLFFDYLRMVQVVVNLLSNALKFSPENSTIIISISKGSLVGNKKSKVIFVSVSDEGGGIPPAELEVIFDKFIQSTTTMPGSGGSGIGLAICREIIAMHGGKIWAENNDKSGAKITFVMPESIANEL